MTFSTKTLFAVTTVLAVALCVDRRVELKTVQHADFAKSAVVEMLEAEDDEVEVWHVKVSVIQDVSSVIDRLLFRRCFAANYSIDGNRKDGGHHMLTNCKSRIRIGLTGCSVVDFQQGPTITMWN